MDLAIVFPKTELRHDGKAVLMWLLDCTYSLDLFVVSQSVEFMGLEKHCELPKVSGEQYYCRDCNSGKALKQGLRRRK